MFETLKTGSLAFYDSFGGLIPCRVLSITGKTGLPSTAQQVVLETTTEHKLYKKGERIECSGIRAVPRKSIYTGSCGIYRIRPYTVETEL